MADNHKATANDSEGEEEQMFPAGGGGYRYQTRVTGYRVSNESSCDCSYNSSTSSSTSTSSDDTEEEQIVEINEPPARSPSPIIETPFHGFGPEDLTAAQNTLHKFYQALSKTKILSGYSKEYIAKLFKLDNNALSMFL